MPQISACVVSVFDRNNHGNSHGNNKNNKSSALFYGTRGWQPCAPHVHNAFGRGWKGLYDSKRKRESGVS